MPLPEPNLPPAALGECSEHGQDVLNGYVGLDVVYGVEDEPAARREGVDPAADLVVDLVGRAERQGLLRVNATTPEDDLIAELLLQSFRFHVRRRCLNGIQDVNTCIYQVWDQIVYGTTGMKEGLPLRILVYPIT